MIKMYAYGEVPNSEIFARDSSGPDVAGTVAEIIARVAAEGDAALLEYTRRFDHAELSSLAVTPGELEEAMGAVEPEFLEVLREAAANIREFHERQKREGFSYTRPDGTVLGANAIRSVTLTEQVSDQEAESLSGEIARKIQEEMVYPGQVKITVIRETRSVAFAK